MDLQITVCIKDGEGKEITLDEFLSLLELVQSKTTRPNSTKKPAASVQDFFDRWNAFASDRSKLATCRKLTDKRRKQIQCRLNAPGWFDDFREAVRSLPLPGDGWQPGLDWLIRNEHNVYLLLEGAFDFRGKDDPAAQRLAQQRRREAIEIREKEEACRKQKIKQAVSGTARVIDNTLNRSNGNGEAGYAEAWLFD